MTLIAPHYHKAKKKAWFSFLKKDLFLVKTPGWLKKMYPGCVWDMQQKEKVLYLTFDDGPHPQITPFLIELLDKYNAKATFFCIGSNVEKYPQIYQQLLDNGHSVGNHTQHHINGWKTETDDYVKDVQQAQKIINSPLFRPPYGRVTRRQIEKLTTSDMHLKVIMWNILAGDWVQELSPEKCFKNISAKIKEGDIIVFHDSEKAWERMSYAVPLLLDFYSKKGYEFKKI